MRLHPTDRGQTLEFVGQLDNAETRNLRGGAGAAVTFDERPARVDGPGKIRDPSPHQSLVATRSTTANGYIGLSPGEIENALAHHHFNGDAGIRCLKAVEESRSDHALSDRHKACHADMAGRRAIQLHRPLPWRDRERAGTSSFLSLIH